MSGANIGSILVVDDEQELAHILAAHLRAAGYEVFTACNGREGIELAGRHQPDLIIMDVAMPEMDGLTATRRLKADKTTRHIPIIMLTGRSRTEDLVLGFEAGAQEYLNKPFDMVELLARVRTVHRLAVSHREVESLNHRLETEIEQKTHRLQLLHDYTRALCEAQTRDEILDLIVCHARDATGSERVSLMLADETGEYLTCERALGMERELVDRIRVKSVEGVAGKVYQSRKTFVAQALGADGASGASYEHTAFLSTPLVWRSADMHEEILGVLNVTEKGDGQEFRDSEIECIRSIADAGTIALNNVIRRERLEKSVNVLLNTVGQLSEYRDDETSLHLERVALYAGVLTRQLARQGPLTGRISEDDVRMIELAAPMHDIGKIGIPDDILIKPGALSDDEYTTMKTHTEIGYRVLTSAMAGTGPVPLLKMCCDIAYCHHERYDGRGYPRGLVGEDIPLCARVIAVVDAYDAITSRRRYKDAKSHDQAVHIIRKDSGAHFDPDIVEAFLQCQAEFDAVRQRHADQAPPPEPVGASAGGNGSADLRPQPVGALPASGTNGH